MASQQIMAFECVHDEGFRMMQLPVQTTFGDFILQSVDSANVEGYIVEAFQGRDPYRSVWIDQQSPASKIGDLFPEDTQKVFIYEAKDVCALRYTFPSQQERTMFVPKWDTWSMLFHRLDILDAPPVVTTRFLNKCNVIRSMPDEPFYELTGAQVLFTYLPQDKLLDVTVDDFTSGSGDQYSGTCTLALSTNFMEALGEMKLNNKLPVHKLKFTVVTQFDPIVHFTVMGEDIQDHQTVRDVLTEKCVAITVEREIYLPEYYESISEGVGEAMQDADVAVLCEQSLVLRLVFQRGYILTQKHLKTITLEVLHYINENDVKPVSSEYLEDAEEWAHENIYEGDQYDEEVALTCEYAVVLADRLHDICFEEQCQADQDWAGDYWARYYGDDYYVDDN